MSNARTFQEVLQESAARQSPPAAATFSTQPPPWAVQMMTESREARQEMKQEFKQIHDQQRQLLTKVDLHDKLFATAATEFHRLKDSDTLQASRLDAQADEQRRLQVARDQPAREQRRQNILVVINNGQQMPAAPEHLMAALNIPAGGATFISKTARTMVMRMVDQAAKDTVLKRPPVQGLWVAHDLTPYQRTMKKQYKCLGDMIVKLHPELRAVWYADRMFIKSATAEAEYPFWRHAGVGGDHVAGEIKRQLSMLQFSTPFASRKRQRAGADPGADDQHGAVHAGADAATAGNQGGAASTTHPTTSSGAGNA